MVKMKECGINSVYIFYNYKASELTDVNKFRRYHRGG